MNEEEENIFQSESFKKHMREISKKGNEKKWAGHKKLTLEEKRAKHRDYMREYRKRKKGKDETT